MARDDVNFVVAVTDGDGTPRARAKRIFASTDGGANWYDAVSLISLF